MKHLVKLFWLRLAFRELKNNAKFSLFFIINLALGLSGFIALDSFKESLDIHLSKNSKSEPRSSLSCKLDLMSLFERIFCKNFSEVKRSNKVMSSERVLAMELEL